MRSIIICIIICIMSMRLAQAPCMPCIMLMPLCIIAMCDLHQRGPLGGRLRGHHLRCASPASVASCPDMRRAVVFRGGGRSGVCVVVLSRFIGCECCWRLPANDRR